MYSGSAVLVVAHVLGCLAGVLALAWLGRAAARRLRQPEVIGEVTAGLLIGPVVHAVVGGDAFDRLLPGEVLTALKFAGEAGLALVLMRLTHELRGGPGGLARRTVSWVVFGALVPSLLLGALLAGCVVAMSDSRLRGSAPTAAFVLFVAVALSITAAPVLARIVADRGLTTTSVGRLALTGAVALDAVGWLLLSTAIGLGTGSAAGLLRVAAIMVAAVMAAILLRFVLRTEWAGAWATRFPRLGAVAVAAAAVGSTQAAERLGLSMILAGVLFGLAIPAGDSSPWAAVAARVSGLGRLLVPVFFVVTGVTVVAGTAASTPWVLLILTTVLAVTGKIGGGYLGARLGGESRYVAAQVGVLLNTRGLTELIVLQMGYSAGILTAPMFLALTVMAVIATVMTGPLLDLLDRIRRIRRPDTGRRTAAVPA
ncbi:cation:proton antiporter [Nocardia sp. CDC159]|uniref:Cation:proton antiporter n=1 Tax=Nocardia pulmonis TaxID=2951408 RepID=A0A9X2E7I7_9NOCA|nr:MULTISPECIES: cation:proton antiporter [Nocardia]MCM6774300.1 cation:proton antiporter [Nocardia pulmonis]MCM6787634.1 cation:proton antiporter [Nocardia sp. CDC159]